MVVWVEGWGIIGMSIWLQFHRQQEIVAVYSGAVCSQFGGLNWPVFCMFLATTQIVQKGIMSVQNNGLTDSIQVTS
ncbi:MAG: hypothetical protein WCK83_07260 [Burkholderiales bacterium]|nr:hypothetical protein [Burkholderiales bacterium]